MLNLEDHKSIQITFVYYHILLLFNMHISVDNLGFNCIDYVINLNGFMWINNTNALSLYKLLMETSQQTGHNVAAGIFSYV